jgi:hypothetical protein
MATGGNDHQPLAWQSTFREMKRLRTRLAFCCTARDCKAWIEQDIDARAHELGWDAMLWDDRPPCAKCGARGHYMASPSQGTPFRPLLSGMMTDAVRRVFLAQFGFTKRDIIRIRLMAEEATALYTPAALNDLDVPYRVGVAFGTSSGEPLGKWNGRDLVWWPMYEREREAWEKRRRGPKPVPSPPRR